MVTNANDSGAGSLRQAIADAVAGDTITFASGISLVSLTSGELVINKNLTIQGPGANLLTVQNTAAASATSRVFNISSGTVTLAGMTISGGNLTGGASGGGIFNSGDLTLRDSVVTGNAVSGGNAGGIYNNGNSVSILNSTISNNSITGTFFLGGGIFLDSGTMTLTNSTVSGNTNAGSTASVGGGIRAEGALSLTNCTIANNTSSGGNPFGGGVSLGNGGTLTTRNTIFSNNSAPQGPDIFGTINSLGYNLISNTANTTISGITTGNILGQSAQLAALANNGGPTPTHALMTGSPAFDAGSNALAVDANNQPLTTDQRGAGFPRQIGIAVDIGAYEFNDDTTPPDTTITSNPTNPSNSTSATFTFTGSDNITPAGSLTFQCQIDGGGFSACTSPQSYTGLADGLRTFQVRAVDQAGNTDPTPASYTWTIVTLPTLGDYADTPLALSGNATLAPVNNQAPTNAVYASATTTSAFKGKLEVDPATGVVRVTNAHPAGTYAVTVRASNAGGTAAKTFNLTVNTPAGCGYFGATSLTGTNFGVSTGPNSVAVGDFNGDGRQDIVTANNFPGINTVSVLLRNSANDDFDPKVDYPAGNRPQAVAVGDLNGDGRQDIIAGNRSGNISVLFRNAANNGFDAAVNLSVADTINSLAVGDLNGDGKPDIAATISGTSTVSVFYRNSDNTGFDPRVDLTATLGPNGLTIADFNGDGRADLVVVSAGGTASLLYRNAGNTGFDPAVNITLPTNNAVPVAAGDFNGDGRQDFAVGYFFGNYVSVYLRKADNSDFDAPVNLTVNSTASIAVGDFNHDGRQDIATANFSSGLAYVLLRTPDNTGFQSPISFGVGSGPNSIAVGDFNGDNRQDLVTANANSNNVTVLQRVCDTTPPDTTITANPLNPSASANASFSFTGSDPGGSGVAGFECQLDGGGFSACTSPQTYTGLSDGSHTFQVRAVDAAGNVDPTPASFTWVIDTVAPTVSQLVRGNSSPTNAGSVTFNLLFSESVTSATPGNFTLVPGGSVTGASITSVVCNMGAGSCVITVNTGSGTGTLGLNMTNSTGVTDSAGTGLNNLPFTGAVYTIDKDAPDTTITSNPVNPTSSTSATFTFTGNDTGGAGLAQFQCKLDGGNFTFCTSPQNYAGLSDGSHTFQVRALDLAGNVDGTPASYTWTIDTLAPTVTINQAAGQNDPTPLSPILFTVVFNEAVTGFDNAADVILSGTAGATTVSITPVSATTYTVSVSGMANGGTVIATVPPGSAFDGANNPNTAATATDNTVTYIVCPTLFTVNDLGDAPDATPGNGVCATAGNVCTLRAAIEEANAITPCSPLTINFSVTGTINLATALPDLNHPNLTINGPGANSLTVQRSTAGGTSNFRIFTIKNITAKISGLTMTNGSATNGGGGFFNSGNLTVNDCVITGNTTSNGGGGIANKATLVMNGCTISNNSSTGLAAGGIWNLGDAALTTATLTNCTISGNTTNAATSQTGGAIDNSAVTFPATATFVNCTITNNTVGSNTNGGGLYSGKFGSFAADIQLKNTIVAGNTDPQLRQDVGGTITSQGFNLVSDNSLTAIVGDLINTNPLFAALGNYGGPTPTHALLPGSPAINAGTNTGAPSADQRGISRAGNVDIGAFESRGFTLALNGGNNQVAASNTAFPNPLSVLVSSSFGEPVTGGLVSFTPPGSGPSATLATSPATINASGIASVIATANAISGGPYLVTASATGASPTINFSLTNNAPPMFTSCPMNQTVNAAAGQCTAPVSFTPTASGIPSPNITCKIGATTITSPYNFPVGTSNVICTATNGVAPDATCSFTVTVNDTQVPTIACPANITNQSAGANCMAVVNFTPPSGADNCGTPTVTCTPASGSSFPLGTTTVSCVAKDAANNMSAACSFTVQVVDTTAPTLGACPANITTNASPGLCATLVTYALPTVSDNCAGATVTCAPASGSSFAIGTTTVTCTPKDAANNVGATCSFTVTVSDNQAPTIACPANLFLGTSGNSAIATWNPPTVNDGCSSVNTPVCTPASGSSFNVGVTTVTCTATDGANNSASCSFTVTVNRVSGSAFDPLACTGPGNTVQATLVISNNGTVNQTVADTTTFTNLKGVPGSCSITPNVGTCVVTSGSLTYSATLTPGQTVTITYLTQASDLAPTGAQVCTNNSVSFNGGNPLAFSVCDVVDCPVVGPGNLLPAKAEMSGQKAGSVLVYNVYTSSTDPTKQNTRLNLTNVHPVLPAFVHLFFVAEGCSIADSYVCLTANQTTSFLASDLDPGTTGYLVAVATDSLGCPINFNYLIGDEYVKFASGHAANLAAESFAALPGGLPACDGNSVTAMLNFDGVSYNRVPAVLALDNVGSRADGNDTLLILNRIGGNLGTGATALGTLFGILYDDSENALSFSLVGSCQFRSSLTSNVPRTTPRFETFIPAGRTGWLKVYNQTGIVGMTGAAINFNANAASSAGAFNQGHNLHALTLTTSSYVIPVFPPAC